MLCWLACNCLNLPYDSLFCPDRALSHKFSGGRPRSSRGLGWLFSFAGRFRTFLSLRWLRRVNPPAGLVQTIFVLLCCCPSHYPLRIAFSLFPVLVGWTPLVMTGCSCDLGPVLLRSCATLTWASPFPTTLFFSVRILVACCCPLGFRRSLLCRPSLSFFPC